MSKILVLGVCPLNDLYPNIKYKLSLLAGVSSCYRECVFDLGARSSISGFSLSRLFGRVFDRLIMALRFLFGHLSVYFRSFGSGAEVVYICYPGIFLILMMHMSGRLRGSRLVLDAFISIYDTMIIDRGVFGQKSLIAKFIYKLERKAFVSADIVLVDTPENAVYYSQLFGLPSDKFFAIPLAIPKLVLPVSPKSENRPFRCLFFGTFVPLQGVPVITQAIKCLADKKDIEFVFIGDGQDSASLELLVRDINVDNLIWHRGHFPTDFVSEQINAADVCFGIFASNEKTRRVLPYKIYYYLFLGAVIITAKTEVTQRIQQECEQAGMDFPLLTTPAGNSKLLAELILAVYNDRVKFTTYSGAARRYYSRHLSADIIRGQLAELVRGDSVVK